MTNGTKSFLAVITSDGHDKVIAAGFGQVPSIIAAEQRSGSTIIREYSAEHVAECARGSPSAAGSGSRKGKPDETTR
jgi:hypothetical protein